MRKFANFWNYDYGAPGERAAICGSQLPMAFQAPSTRALVDAANRGAHRHFLPMRFTPPCFAETFFFDAEVLRIVRGVMDHRVVADQWGCDVPVQGSEYQGVHADYQRPLFGEAPNLLLPVYMLVVSFGLVRIAPEHGPIEIAPGTQRMAREEVLRAI